MRISDWSSDVCSSDLVGRFEHRLALTQNTNGAGSGLLGARGSRRPRELGETGIDERIVRAAQIVDQPVAAVTDRCTYGHYASLDRPAAPLRSGQPPHVSLVAVLLLFSPFRHNGKV